MKRRVQTAAHSLRGVIMSSPYTFIHSFVCFCRNRKWNMKILTLKVLSQIQWELRVSFIQTVSRLSCTLARVSNFLVLFSSIICSSIDTLAEYSVAIIVIVAYQWLLARGNIYSRWLDELSEFILNWKIM